MDKYTDAEMKTVAVHSQCDTFGIDGGNNFPGWASFKRL